MNAVFVVKSALNKFLEKRLSLLSWSAIFLAAIFLKSFIEQFLAVSRPITLLETAYQFIHNLYFFSISLLLIWILLSFILKVKPQKLSFFFIFSLFLVILPPLIDMARNHGETYWSFYILSSPAELLKQYLTIFGHLPSGIVYFGTKIVIIASIIAIAGSIWFLTKNIFKAILGAIVSYTIFFFLGSFPTLTYYIYAILSPDKNISDVRFV